MNSSFYMFSLQVPLEQKLLELFYCCLFLDFYRAQGVRCLLAMVGVVALEGVNVLAAVCLVSPWTFPVLPSGCAKPLRVRGLQP